MSESIQRKVWSDFDGTAVKLAGRAKPRHWLKYPLASIEGYTDFLGGLQAGGVDVAGVVTRRPNILPRRIVTNRSIGKLGLSSFYSKEEQVVLTGSESRKAEFIADKALGTVVGLIDDRPHRVGPEIVRALSANQHRSLRSVVMLGVVDQPKASQYLVQFGEMISQEMKTYDLEYVTSDAADDGAALQIQGPDNRYKLVVVPLQPYSSHAGESFAEQILAEK